MVFPVFAFYDVTLQEDGGVTGTATVELKLRDGADLTYTGSTITPAEVEYGESWLGGDPTVSYDNNIDAGTATVSAAKGSAEVSLQFVISPKSAKSVAVSPIPEQIYTGAPIVPSLTIKDGGTELTQGKDCTVTCSDNTAVGTAKVTVDFSGNYFGTKTVYFDIAYAELPEGSTISDYASVPSPNENGWYNGDIVITAEGGASVGFTEDTAGEVIVSDEGEGTKTIVIKDSGGRIYQTDFEYKLDKTPPIVTLEPVTDSSQWTDDGYTVFITADDSLSLVDYGSITVTKNGEPFETGSGTPNFTADENGNYMFTDVPEGVYNIAASKDGGTVTILVTVSDSDISGADTSLGDGSKNSVVEIAGENTPDVVVGGLDEIATDDQSGDLIEVKMTVTVKEDVTGSSEIGDAQLKEEQNAIKSIASGKTVEFIDMSLTKSVNGGEPFDIGDSNTHLVTIVIPFEKGGKQDTAVYRFLGGDAESLMEGEENAAGGEYFTVTDDAVTIYAEKFSLYAIGYTVPSDPDTYPSVNKGSENGSYTVYPSFPEAGSTVTVTPKPDDGYTVDTVTVTDSKGNTVAVTKGENSKYTYVQPSCAVTVAVTFKPGSGAFDCPRDESCPMAAFDDLSLGAWYHDGVHYCIDEDIMKGVDDGVFAPDVSTSRAMIAVMLWRLDGSPDMDGQNLGYPYADVNPDSWYTDAVYWARLNGVVTGYDTEHFGTGDAVTREQLAAMLFRYAKYKGIDVSKYESTVLSSFADAAYISDYALSAVKWACGAGIIKGAGDEFSLSPKGEASRAEIAVMFMRYCVNISK